MAQDGDGVSARLPVLGLDIGGTWTRALVADAASGARLGSARRAGANPMAHGVPAASGEIAAAVAQALHEAGLTDASSIAACAVGMAGAGKLTADPAAAAAFAELWQGVGLECEVEILPDVTTAFAAGTAASDGSVLLAGTGAVAATIRNRRPTSVYGGHGWLLGDEGSGYWIGRQAVRATLAALDDGATATTGLFAAVIDAYAPGREPRPQAQPELEPRPRLTAGSGHRSAVALITAVNARPPVELAALVPLVIEAFEHGDPDAVRILHDAAEALLTTLSRAYSSQAEAQASPIVLAGGILTSDSPVHRLVHAAITRSWPDAPVTTAHDGEAAAAWLAALHLLGDGPTIRNLHKRLVIDRAE